MAQRKTERKNLQGEQTRTRILEETMSLTARYGFSGTNVSMIRKATGLSASSIYWHFADKDQLVAAALDHCFQVQTQSLPNWLDTPPGEPRWADLFDKIHQLPPLDHRMDYWRFGLKLAAVRPQAPSPVRDRFLQIRSDSVFWLGKWWERSLPEAMEQRAAAAQLLGRCTLAIRDSEFIERYGSRQLDADRVTGILASVIDVIADLTVELSPGRPFDGGYTSAPQPETAHVEGGRDAFLQAAEKTIAEFGYDGVTVARICEKAALPASSLYWSFEDKDDLVAAVIDNACRGWESDLPDLQPRPADGDWSGILQGFVLRTLVSDVAETKVRRLGLLLMLQPAAAPGVGRQRLEPVLRNMQSMTEEWFRTVLAPDLGKDFRVELAEYLAECLFRILDGLMLSRQIDGNHWDPELLSEMTSTALFRIAVQAQSSGVILQEA